MTSLVVGKLISHIQQQVSECGNNAEYYTKSYNNLLNGKDGYITEHKENIKFYTEWIERLRSEISQLELFKKHLVTTTDIMYDGEIVHCIDNYIANIRLKMEHLSNTLLHKQSLDIEVDYEQQLSLLKRMMDDYLVKDERQQNFNKEYLLVKDVLEDAMCKYFGD